MFGEFLDTGFGGEVGADFGVVGPFKFAEGAFAEVFAGFDFEVFEFGEGSGGLDAPFEVAGEDALDVGVGEGLGEGLGLLVSDEVEFDVGVALRPAPGVPFGLTVPDEVEAHSYQYIWGEGLEAGDFRGSRGREGEVLDRNR